MPSGTTRRKEAVADPVDHQSPVKNERGDAPPPSRGRWNCLQASGDTLVPGGAHPGIAILAGRELVWCDTRSNPLFALGMVNAESVRKGEMARDHLIVHLNRDNDAGSLRAETGVSSVGEAESGGITWRDAESAIGIRLAPLGIAHDRVGRE